MVSIVWTKAKKVFTRTGQMYVRSWDVPSDKLEGFKEFWSKNKIKLSLQGFSVKIDLNGTWVLNEWQRKLSDFSDIGTESDRTERKFIIPEKSSLIIEEISDKSGLRNWQPNLAATLVASIKKHGAAIDGSETGSGKTYTAIGVARQLGYKVGVVCPKAVITSWTRVIENHFRLTPAFVINYESLRTGKYKHIATWERTSKKSKAKKFVWKISDPEKTLIIYDESHKLKDGKTLNSKCALAAKKQGYKILCCSATSAINPIELKTVGNILGLHDGTSKGFEQFLLEHGCEHGRFGWEFTGSKNVLQKLNFDIFKERGVRIRKDDIPGFPECETIAEAYDMDELSKSEINRIMSDMENEIQNFNKSVKSDKEKAMNALVTQLRARQRCELIKVPLIIDQVEESIENGMSVVVIVNFTETINALEARLKTNCIIWGQDTKNRQANIDKFQRDESRIILVNIMAGGTGLSLHDTNGKYPRISLISPPPSAVNLKQALGRIHRDGAKSKAIQKILFVAGTSEEEICQKMKLKLDNMDLINDGDLSPSPIFRKL